MWRLNLETGRFMASLQGDSPELNVVKTNPVHQLISMCAVVKCTLGRVVGGWVCGSLAVPICKGYVLWSSGGARSGHIESTIFIHVKMVTAAVLDRVSVFLRELRV